MKNSTQSSWRRALAELKKGNLAEERSAFRRCYNMHDEPTIAKKSVEQPQLNDEELIDSEYDDIVIILPECVRKVAEARNKIDPQ